MSDIFNSPLPSLTCDLTVSPATPADVVCDWCGAADVCWSYPATDVVAAQFPWASRGDWAACDSCHGLIERGAWHDLLARSVATSGLAATPSVQRVVGDLHAAFRRARTGPARPYVKRHES